MGPFPWMREIFPIPPEFKLIDLKKRKKNLMCSEFLVLLKKIFSVQISPPLKIGQVSLSS